MQVVFSLGDFGEPLTVFIYPRNWVTRVISQGLGSVSTHDVSDISVFTFELDQPHM